MNSKIRVGIVGLQPGKSWAARAHVPALRALSAEFEIVGVANSTLASGQAAAASLGIPRAFENAAALAASPDIDLVTVTTRVPQHFELVSMALRAGKHVYCEWPLGNGLAEAEQLAALCGSAGVLGVCGTQARVAPAIIEMRKQIDAGLIGTVLSSSIVAASRGWGATIPTAAGSAYLFDIKTGANMLTIPFGHTLAALRDVLGDVTEVSALLATRRSTVTALDTGETLPVTSPDQVIVTAQLRDGAPVSIHFRGGDAFGTGLVWQVTGSQGELRLTAGSGHTQLEPLTLEAARTGDKALSVVSLPAQNGTGLPEAASVGNVARMYGRLAHDLRSGSQTAPTFADAVGLHRIIDLIEQSARTGQRVAVDAPNRALPEATPS